MLDHTDDPAGWFNDLFARLAIGARFIFQVNLSKPELARSAEHARMHPSPLSFEEVMAWLAAKSERFEHFVETEPNGDNEFYFLSWGTKTRDDPVTYRAAAAMPVDLPRKSAASAPGHDAAPRPLVSGFTSAWLSATRPRNRPPG